ncbi:MAG: anti-sigma factor antagonist [Coriobacteriales bacterium]|nr:anti-sigma factor antagonist [Coriobacteriales bacterium]
MSHEHDIVLVPLAGDLTVRTAPLFKQTLDRFMAQGSKRIVLNMAEVTYVDSAGMAAIFHLVRDMRARGGLVSLVNVSRHVLRSLKIARLVDLIPVSALGTRKEVPTLDPSVQPLWRTTLPVDMADMHAVRARIEEMADKMGFSPDAAFDLTLAAGEALGNAVDHTSGSGVLATVSAYPDRMVVDVTDCGEGFTPDEGDAAPASTSDGERGRGIRLMQLLVDSVSIKARPSGVGTVVRLVKLM